MISRAARAFRLSSPPPTLGSNQQFPEDSFCLGVSPLTLSGAWGGTISG